MPLFKIWSDFGGDCMKKSVVVNSYDELLKKSVSKLALGNPSSIKICLEDGTEVDDDETLQCLDKGTVLIVTTDFAGKRKKVPDGESSSTDFQAISKKMKNDADLDFEEEEKLKDEKETSQTNSPYQLGKLESDTEACEVKGSAAGTELNYSPAPQSDDQDFNVEGRSSFTKKLTCSDAEAKGLKMYSDKEIRQASSEMERRYREFWNEKGNQLCREPATKHKSKSALHGIIDVSWTLRKTTLLESMVNITVNEENAVMEEKPGKGKQKKNTLGKNLDRMKSAHAEVVSLDEELIQLKKDKNSNRAQATTKTLLDGAYTNLKRAQEALSKSIKQRRRQIEQELNKAKHANDDVNNPQGC
ncbi:hypothetical protein AC249_AIPGENE25670 [Exaiptasia diaphana]|nr:hypothetical protein AC249_AIPGENE25670 [Exaiptasia diaphana]